VTNFQHQSGWHKAYLKYREIEKRFTDCENSSKNLLVLIHAGIKGRKYFEKKLDEYQAVRKNSKAKKLPARISST
jgi:hypothetical protein